MASNLSELIKKTEHGIAGRGFIENLDSNYLKLLVPLARIELAANGLGIRCSIH